MKEEEKQEQESYMDYIQGVTRVSVGVARNECIGLRVCLTSACTSSVAGRQRACELFSHHFYISFGVLQYPVMRRVGLTGW